MTTAMEKVHPTTQLDRAPAAAGLALTGRVQISSMGEVFRLANALSQARGFVPRAYAGDANAIAAAILTGIELGIGPMEALRSIHMIEGKPTMSSEMMLGRAMRAGIRCRWVRTDANGAEIEVTRDGYSSRLSFTMDDARAAGLAGKGNWKTYPAAMLRARCASAAMRAFCPDVLGAGVYTPEELAPDAPVREDGTPAVLEAQVVEQAPVAAPAARPFTERLDECQDADELLSYLRASAERLVSLTNGRRAKAMGAIESAAKRVGIDELEALTAAGLISPTGEQE